MCFPSLCRRTCGLLFCLCCSRVVDGSLLLVSVPHLLSLFILPGCVSCLSSPSATNSAIPSKLLFLLLPWVCLSSFFCAANPPARSRHEMATWAQGDLTYVPSDVLRERAQARGIPDHKLMQFGLPVRDAFW